MHIKYHSDAELLEKDILALMKDDGKKSEAEKSLYLKNLFEQTYILDIVDRNGIKRIDVMDAIVNILASAVGSLTNPQKIYETFKSNGEKELSLNTINSYLSFLEDSFIVSKALRYDVKGRKYINTPQKYYFSDLGLRNARLNAYGTGQRQVLRSKTAVMRSERQS